MDPAKKVMRARVADKIESSIRARFYEPENKLRLDYSYISLFNEFVLIEGQVSCPHKISGWQSVGGTNIMIISGFEFCCMASEKH